MYRESEKESSYTSKLQAEEQTLMPKHLCKQHITY